MNFCSHCGSSNIVKEIPKDDHRLRHICKDCGKIFYENPRIVVGTIPVFENKILLAKRAIEPQKGKWNLPAGFLEMNETTEKGAIRETLEETGAEIKNLSLHTIFQSDSNHIYIIFLANLKNTNINTTNESTEVNFFDINEIPWDELAFTSNEFALKSFLSKDKNTDSIFFKME
jgi:ADP-ribose pyrophosphatase YjhB (NUDIX family)